MSALGLHWQYITSYSFSLKYHRKHFFRRFIIYLLFKNKTLGTIKANTSLKGCLPLFTVLARVGYSFLADLLDISLTFNNSLSCLWPLTQINCLVYFCQCLIPVTLSQTLLCNHLIFKHLPACPCQELQPHSKTRGDSIPTVLERKQACLEQTISDLMASYFIHALYVETVCNTNPGTQQGKM